MLRSLFSGVSGMKNQQTKMDVIGNNIANANTTAFKASRVTFKDMLSQTTQSASSPTVAAVPGNLGGTNPKQVGLGMAVASIDTDMSQGGLQPTSRATDLAVQGNGFFVVYDGVKSRFTRDGSFTIDKNGYLITAEGLKVRGQRDSGINVDAATGNVTSTTVTTTNNAHALVPDPVNPAAGDNLPLSGATGLKDIIIPRKANVDGVEVELTSFSIERDGKIKALYGDKAVEVGRIPLANFQNPMGLEKTGGNMYIASSNSGDPAVRFASDPGYGTVEQGFLEMSRVDLANEFTEMIITSRAYQANSKTITTSDEMLQELLNLKR
jgi:flagellar hook protein FlgE